MASNLSIGDLGMILQKNLFQAIFMTLILLFSITSCGENDGSDTGSEAPIGSVEEETVSDNDGEIKSEEEDTQDSIQDSENEETTKETQSKQSQPAVIPTPAVGTGTLVFTVDKDTDESSVDGYVVGNPGSLTLESIGVDEESGSTVFIVENIPEGNQDIVVTAGSLNILGLLSVKDRGLRQSDISIESGKVKDLGEIVVPIAGGLQGVAAKFGAEDHSLIQIAFPGTNIPIGVTSRDGIYNLKKIPVGTHLISFSADGYITQEKTITVKSGEIIAIPSIELAVNTGVSGTFVINDGAFKTNKTKVTLSITVPSQAILMAISENPNFIGASNIPVTGSIDWTFADADLEKKTIYIKFIDKDGIETVTSNTITYQPDFSGVDSLETLSGTSGMSSLKATFAAAGSEFNRYHIYYRLNNGSYPIEPQQIFVPPNPQLSTLNANIGGLAFNKTYCVLIKAAKASDPSDPESYVSFESINGSDTEVCKLVYPKKPIFTNVFLSQSATSLQGATIAAIEIKFPKASGLFNQYHIYLNEGTNEPSTSIAVLNSNLERVSGLGDVRTCSSGDPAVGCVTIDGLKFETNYAVKMRAKYISSALTFEDDPTDDVYGFYLLTTTFPPPAMPPSSGQENFSFLIYSELQSVAAVDGSELTSQAPSTNGLKAFQEFGIKFPATMSIPNDVVNFTPKAWAYGSGDDGGGGTDFGAELSVYKFDQLGSGRDGDFVTTGGFDLTANINTDSGRSVPDIVEYKVDPASISTGSATVTLANSATPDGILVGEEVVLFFKQVAYGESVTDVGTFMLTTISSISGSDLTLAQTVSYTPPAGAVISIQRIPHYKNVTLGGDLTVAGFNKSTALGGLLMFRAQGQVNLGGFAINMEGKGYAGGTMAADHQGRQGDSRAQGNSIVAETANESAGGGTNSGNYGKEGGGGGGYAGLGEEGTVPAYAGDGSNVSLGTAQMTKIFFGGGGGGATTMTGAGRCYGDGAPGGGAVVLYARSIINGSINARGSFYSTTRPYANGNWGGGSGGGGAIKLGGIDFQSLALDVNGGQIPDACFSANRAGGGGGGRIRIDGHHRVTTYETVSGTGYSAGSTYFGSATAYIQSVATNNAASNNENISLSGSTISSSIANYFNADKEIILRVESSYSKGTIDSVINTDAVHLEYTRP